MMVGEFDDAPSYTGACIGPKAPLFDSDSLSLSLTQVQREGAAQRLHLCVGCNEEKTSGQP
jgi:hypothetical protein